MTLPQQRLPGATCFITACCDRRQARLPPEPETNAGFAIAMVEAAERYGIKIVCATTVMNHYHAVVYDEHGSVSDFLRDFHSVMARFGNARDGVRAIGFWDRQQVDVQVLGDALSVARKVAYCIANPTTSFLVSRPERWPGVWTRIEDLGRWRGPVFRRPERFFDPAGWVSESVELAWELPPAVEASMGIEGFQARVRHEVERLIVEAHSAAEEAGHGFMGLAKVRAIGVWDAPSSPSPRKVGREAVARRRVSAVNRAVVRAMATALVVFWQVHRRAWEAYQRGERVVFPAGSWKAWRFYGARRVAGRAVWSEAPG